MLYGAPLCPAGHLPHKGGDQPSFLPALLPTVAEKEEAQTAGLISPLVGEMSDRTEGGATGRYACLCDA
jgi:hypothetical protein